MNGLKTHIWISALLRRAQISGASGFIVRKGDPDAGIAIIKVSTLDGFASVYMPTRNMEMQRIWRRHAELEDRAAEELIAGRIKNDPDVWIVEIEERSGEPYLMEDIEDA